MWYNIIISPFFTFIITFIISNIIFSLILSGKSMLMIFRSFKIVKNLKLEILVIDGNVSYTTYYKNGKIALRYFEGDNECPPYFALKKRSKEYLLFKSKYRFAKFLENAVYEYFKYHFFKNVLKAKKNVLKVEEGSHISFYITKDYIQKGAHIAKALNIDDIVEETLSIKYSTQN